MLWRYRENLKIRIKRDNYSKALELLRNWKQSKGSNRKLRNEETTDHIGGNCQPFWPGAIHDYLSAWKHPPPSEIPLTCLGVVSDNIGFWRKRSEFFIAEALYTERDQVLGKEWADKMKGMDGDDIVKFLPCGRKRRSLQGSIGS